MINILQDALFFLFQLEKYTIPREGANLTSGVDSRVSIDIKPNFFKVSSQVELEVYIRLFMCYVNILRKTF